MSNIYYQRDAVPVGERIRLEVIFKDSAGNLKDADTTPLVEINDATDTVSLGSTASGVVRTGVGSYKYEYTVPDGYSAGIWNDTWASVLDGYSLTDVFNFTVDSIGTIEASGSSVPEVEYTLDDDEIGYEYTQEEIRGILLLRGILKQRLRSTAYKPDGTSCPVFSNDLLNMFLCAALSELNATPTFTTYSFADNVIQTLAVDLMTQGAMLVAWSSQAVVEAGFELTVSDNGVVVNPPPVSSTITGLYNTQLSDYRNKLKEFKRNHRPSPLGMGAGSLLVNNNPRVRRLRFLKERRIL